MKIAVITDAHANLPALRAALYAIQTEGCDLIFHAGDAIAIGPYPAECIDLLESIPNLKCVRGNHDQYFVDGLPEPQPEWMSDGEVEHQRWTQQQLGEQRRSFIAEWPFVQEEIFEGVKTVFVHYGRTASKNEFVGIIRNPHENDLDMMFAEFTAQILFFGHDHSPSDINGRARYINPGSLGCSPQAFARYTIATFVDNQAAIQHCSVPYEDKELFEAFEDRDVPEREFLYKAFFGGRFEIKRKP